jgi:hypothetical protein
VLTLTDWVVVLLPIILGLMGAYVSIRPPKEKHHWLWVTLFIVFGVLFAAETLLQISINRHDAEEDKRDLNFRIGILQQRLNRLSSVPKSLGDLQSSLDKTQQALKPTPKPLRSHIHILRFELHPLSPGESIKMNVFFKNDGQAPAEWEGYFQWHRIETPKTEEGAAQEDKQFAKFLEGTKRLKPVRNTIPVDAERFVTATAPRITSEQIEEVKSKTYILYLTGRLIYRDPTGTHRTDYCLGTFGDPSVLFFCHRHNEEP